VVETARIVPLDVPRSANVAELEAELSALWRSAAEDPTTRQAVTRACALALLVYVESEEAGREVSGVISEAMRQTPFRAVIMISEPQAAPAGLAAWVSAHCHLPTAGEKQVCCEEVTVRARGEAGRDLDKVVLPLTVPGLPVYLWWRAGRFSPPEYFEPILRVANRVLVDSARFPEPEKDLAELAAEVHERCGGAAFCDLNWTRITPWRELIAQCFDSVEMRPVLDRLTSVQFEYGSKSARAIIHQCESLLLTGWLASRLKWEPVPQPSEVPSERRRSLFRAGERAIEVQHVARSFEDGGAGVCISISLQAGGTSPAEVSLMRKPDGMVVSIRTEVEERVVGERTVRLEVPTEIDLINEELKISGHDRIYEEALDMVVRMTTAKVS
jgi:glucose-6-phosphate dehydrogenase assembly protein OpcA